MSTAKARILLIGRQAIITLDIEECLLDAGQQITS